MSKRGASYRVHIDKALIKSCIKKGGGRAVYVALDHLRTVSQQQVPLDQGPLKASAEVDVAADGMSGTVSYDMPYAVKQHEDTQLSHQRGRKAKYLEDPASDPEVQNQMAELMRSELSDAFGG